MPSLCICTPLKDTFATVGWLGINIGFILLVMFQKNKSFLWKVAQSTNSKVNEQFNALDILKMNMLRNEYVLLWHLTWFLEVLLVFHKYLTIQ